MDKIIYLWNHHKDAELKKYMTSLSPTFCITKIDKLWNLFSTDKTRIFKITTGIARMRLLTILLTLYIEIYEKESPDHFNTYWLINELQADYISIMGSSMVIKLWNIMKHWNHDNEMFVDICKTMLEEVFTNDEMISSADSNEKIIQTFLEIYTVYYLNVNSDDRISFISYFYQVHYKKPSIQNLMKKIFEMDQDLKKNIALFVLRSEMSDMDDFIIKMLNDKEKKFVFEQYRNKLLELLEKKRKNPNTLFNIQKYKKLSQWAIRISKPTVQQQERRRQYSDIYRTKNIQTASSVIQSLYKIDQDIKSKNLVDPYVLRQLDIKIRKSIVHDSRLRAVLLSQLFKRKLRLDKMR